MQRRHLCSASACVQPRKDKKEPTIKMVISFPPEEVALLLAKERWWRTTLWQGRLLSASARARWEETTIKKRSARGHLVCRHCSFFIFVSEPKPKPISVQHVTIANLRDRYMSFRVANNLLERCKSFWWGRRATPIYTTRSWSWRHWPDGGTAFRYLIMEAHKVIDVVFTSLSSTCS